MFSKLKQSSRRQRMALIAGSLSMILAIVYLAFQSSWPKVDFVKVAYSEKSPYPVGFCTQLRYEKVVSKNPGFKAWVNHRAAKDGQILINQNIGIYCFAAPGKYQTGQEVDIKLDSNGESVIDQKATLPAPQAPKVTNVKIIPDMLIGRVGSTNRISPIRVIVLGEFIGSLQLQIGFNNHWFKVGSAQSGMTIPPLQGASGGGMVSSYIPFFRLPRKQKIITRLRYQKNGHWYPAYKSGYIQLP